MTGKAIFTAPARYAACAARLARCLLDDVAAISIVEFALVLPIMLTLGLYGTEVARLASVKMKVSQIALSIADNASRLGQTDNAAVAPTITEGNVDAVLNGAIRDGLSIDLQTNGRIVISSLEYDGLNDQQYIHWQRCQGNLDAQSAYGEEDPDVTGTPITGMGSGTTQITAQPGTAVMFVEIYYNYDPLFQNPFGSGALSFKQEAAYLIRDDRDLEPGLTGGGTTSSCS